MALVAKCIAKEDKGNAEDLGNIILSIYITAKGVLPALHNK